MGGLRLDYDDNDTSDSDNMENTHPHVNGGTFAAAPAANGAASQHAVDSDDEDVEALLRQWKRTFPSRLKPEELSVPDLVIFMARALTLVSSGEEHMETVIMALTSEGGSARLRQFLDRNFNNLNENALSMAWRHLILVYFKIMSHDTVLESEAVDYRHASLMNQLYGTHGKRGSSVFAAAHRSLLAQMKQTHVPVRTTQEHIEICIAVLYCMLTQRESKVTPELRTITEAFLALLPSPHLSGNTDSRVLSIRTILSQSHTAYENVSSLPSAGVNTATHSAANGALAIPAKVGAAIPHTALEASRGPAPSTFTLRKATAKKQPTTTLRKLKAAPATAPEAALEASEPLHPTTANTQASTFPTSDANGVHLRPTFTRHDNDMGHIHKIQIMPTLQEILSDKMPYLPREDPSTWHKSGMPGVVDRHFRLVREDTIGQLRIAVKNELAALQRSESNPNPISSSAHTMSEIQGARTNVYHDVVINKLLFDPYKGMQFILTISQPPSASHSRIQDREAWWKREQRLGPDSLLCLLSANGAAHFLVVHNPPPPKPGKKPNPNALHKRYTLGMHRERAFLIAELASTNPDDASALLRTLADTSATTKVRRSLVEFPGQILQSFAPTLAALQKMSTRIGDIPFADALTPDFKNFKPSPPAYSRARGFQYQLQALLSEDERGRPGRTNIDSILKRSVLDDVQQDAVKHALSNELALIQGPPGTGKSFTGVKLIEALLENKSSADLGPVICVCFTNHALDQLLEHLMDAGVSNLIRMGSRSKSERLAPVNIREVAMNYSPEDREGAQMGRARKSIRKTEKNMCALLNRWHGVLFQKHVEDAEITTLMARDYPACHKQLLGATMERGPFTESPIQQWLQGAVNDTSNEGGRGAMFAMSKADRKNFHQKLLLSTLEDIYQELEFELGSFYGRKDIIDVVRGDIDLRALSNADVIGVTTSGLAGKYNRLRKMRSKVVVVEEAGEVLEAHLLTAMLPSIEHAILIGDHQQLRPKVNNYDLSIDNPCSRITLDVSLFERLVSPRYDLSPGLPFVTLEMQRRMHPSVSNLIRSTLYPRLGDAPNVHSYPPVAGMAKRLFWMDHRNKEDDSRNNPQSVSQSNKWEVGMVAALVGHLQKQGTYSPGDIAVLTPYSGQLKELQSKLGGTCGIMLSERDIDDGIQANGNGGRSRNAIRLSTVDAFQGEEAKVIIISMVRSNDKKICGFLGTTNRINVLLSRAMHGMYIIGNSNTTSEVTMWQNIVNLLKAEGNFGPALEIACGRHPSSEAPLLVREPRDFLRVSPEAGCNAECGEQLPCGHLCLEKCHSEAMHNRVKCKQPCDLPMEDCEHLCPKPCSEEYEPNCKAMIPCDLSLPCGHHLTEMQCFQQHQKAANIRCRVGVEQVVPKCGHRTISPCYFRADDPKFRCEEACGAVLTCGHSCEKDCSDCRPRDRPAGSLQVDHGRCIEECGRELPDCTHSCSKACHGTESSCPPCSAPCQSECAHMECNKRCADSCPPCTKENCSSGCPHSTCGMPCAAPCDLIPCSKRCKEKLKCGHPCPSVCGEICPAAELCQRCSKDNIKSMIVDPITRESYEDVEQQCLFLRCGHIFTVGALDRYMDMASHYEMDDYRGTSIPVALRGDVEPLSCDKPKGCPTCHGTVHTISRYGHIVRRALLGEKVKKLIASSNQASSALSQRLEAFKKSLDGSINEARLLGDITLGVKTTATGNPYQSVLKGTSNRYMGAVVLRTEIRNLVEKIQRDELPFQKVREMVQTAGRRKNPEFDTDQTISQPCTSPSTTQALLLDCELVIASDLLALWQSKQGKQPTKLSVDFSKNRQDCDALLAGAIQSQDILHRAKAHMFWAKFLALDCAARSQDVELVLKVRAKKNEGLARLAQAEEICEEYPEETKSIAAEFSVVREMLR